MSSSSRSALVFFCFFFLLFVSAAQAQSSPWPRFPWFFHRYPPHTAPPLNSNYHQINLPGRVLGPESLAFDCNGRGPYVGVSDGRVLRWHETTQSWVEFAVTSPHRNRLLCDGSSNKAYEPICGRPLGLKFHPKTCELYIADAYFGLLKVGRNGGVATQLATSAESIPFRFLNDLDVNPETGVVYFTDSSIRYERRDFNQLINARDRSGRLLKYDPITREVSVLYRGLAFPNGVVLAKDNSYLLLVESTNNQILKFLLYNDHHYGVPQVFARVDRFPDNIRRTEDGHFWVALNTERNLQSGVAVPVGVKFDEYGRLIRVVNGDGRNSLEFVSEIEEHNGRLWFGSPKQPYVGTIPN
ncbi:protein STRICTOSIDINE SYNTHASE-LIKE 10-like [Mercurialis annua]|uniref:protein STRICTOSIDINE SYNTHASE-LIKE 10-like n=1 Tax=Mercurialis annua TaxID=3986 RepID=UPI00215FADFF|nr:protein STRICTOSIDINE SYNTHASE-LIKE 10-like [Mercurialis annua]